MNLKDIPLSKDFPKFKFPAYTLKRSAEGNKFYIYHDPGSALVSARIGFRGGAFSEGIPGLAGFAAKMLTNGTVSRSAVEISSETEYLGASINATAQWDKAYIGATALEKHIIPVLEIMKDCFLNPAFSQEEIDRQKNIHLAAIREEHSEPQYLAKFAFNSGMYPNHPFGHPLAGTIDSISAMTVDDIRNWYKNEIVTGPLSFFLCGNLENPGIENILAGIGEYVKTSDNPVNDLNLTEYPPKTGCFIIKKSGAVQTTLRMGLKTLDITDNDFIPLQMANVILGGYFQSRLNNILRQEKGFTYGVYSSLITRKAGVELSIGADINEESTRESVQIIMDELNRMKNEIIPIEEFNKARQYFLGSFARRLETPQQVITLLQTIDNFGLDANYYDKFFERVSNLTPEEVFEAQKKTFGSDKVIIAASGNIDNLEKMFADFGEVNIIDVNGA